MKVFIIGFICAAILYSLIASFSNIFYKNKSMFDLSIAEKKILNGELLVKIDYKFSHGILY